MRATDVGRGGERGQSTALVASLLFVLMLFVAVVADVGQAVNRRIALQVVADAGAYTGGSVLAVGFNQLAVWNRVMQYAWFLFTEPPVLNPIYDAFKIGNSYSCSVSDTLEEVYGGAMIALHLIFRVENAGYRLLSHSEAKRASDFNAADLFPGETLSYSESDFPQIGNGHRLGSGGSADVEQVPDGTLPKAISFLRFVPFQNVLLQSSQRQLDYTCEQEIPAPPFIIILPRSSNYLVWFRKVEGSVDSFVWEVTAPATSALMFDQFFGGPKIIPEMKAIAVAKPIGGNIEEGRNEYITKIMPVASVMTANALLGGLLPGFLQRWSTDMVGGLVDFNYDRQVRIVTH